MIKEILTAAAVEHAQGRFVSMPVGTYAVYFDDLEVETADRVASVPATGLPRIYHHNITIELYEPKPDDDAENAIESELDARGLDWAKQDRYWLKDLKRYQTVYEFSYTSKTK